MLTIDDMLSQVAKITGAVPTKSPEVKKTEPPKADVHIKEINGLSAKPVLSLSLAKEIIYCIEKGAEKHGLNVVITVVNDGGRMIAFEAMDNSYLASVKASQDKAYTASALKMPTEEALKESRGGAFDGLTNGDGILMLGGGCPLYAGDYIVGAVGVSGGTKEQDIMLARLGAKFLEARINSMSQ